MIRLSLMLVFLFCAQPEEPILKLIKKIPVKGTNFTTDALENVYVIHNTELIKYSKDGSKTASFSDNSLGTIQSVDASDPMRILVYFADFNRVVFLNNSLAEIASPVLLDDMGISDVGAICSSAHGGFWIFDQLENNLKYFDKSLNLKQKGSNIAEIANDQILPSRLVERNDFLYMNIPSMGIIIFDRFGSFYKKIPLTTITKFQIWDQKIFYYSEPNLLCYDPELVKTDTLALTLPQGVMDVRLGRDRIYTFNKDGFEIFSLNK